MKFSIVKRYKIFFAITITFLIIGIGSMLFKGFNLGIDFTGGSIMDLEFKILLPFLRYVMCLKKRIWAMLLSSWKAATAMPRALRAC